MRILIVIPALSSVYGGPSKSVVELAQSLGSLGLSVDIVATNASGSTKLEVPLHTWLTEKSYRIKYFPYWRSARLQNQLVFDQMVIPACS
jgi:hypothetical protein